MNNPAVSNAYQQALNLTRDGQLQAAEALCLKIISQQARHGDAWLLLGVIELQSGRAQQAVQTLTRASDLQPNHAVCAALLGDASLASARAAEALVQYDRALRLSPHLPPALFGRGNALLDLGRPAEAIACYDLGLAADPGNAELHFNRGTALLKLGRNGEALNSFDRAVELQPDYAAAHLNRGSALRLLRRPAEALASFERSLALRPAWSEAHCGRGDALLDLQRVAAALQAYAEALRLDPRSRPALLGRGNCHFMDRRFESANADYDAVLRADPFDADATNNKGNVLLATGRMLDALSYFDRTLLVRPDHAKALRSRADLLVGLQRYEEAAESFTQLLAFDGDIDDVPGALFHTRQCLADWSAAAPRASQSQIVSAALQGAAVDSPFSFLAVTDSAAAQLACATTFATRRWPEAAPRWSAGRCAPQRIRVAYVSSDLRAHAVSYLMAGVFEMHDRSRFDVTAISLRPAEDSVTGRRVHRAFERFIDVSGMADTEVASLMRELQIDIAVDLVGYTDGLRPRIFALRPAPVSVSYLGFPGTSGAPHIDYLVADDFVVPNGMDRYYSEKIARLPNCFQANDDRRTLGARPATRAAAGLPDDALVLCSFSNTYKFNPATFDVWMRILASAPRTALWLLSSGPTAASNLRREAQKRGIDSSRLIFAGRVPYDQHLGRLRLADLALDTLPFNGGTTTSDALWAGVPVLACAGEAFASRMAGSLLRTAGLQELVTTSLTDYEARAIQLATTPGLLSELRTRVATARHASPLFDTARTTRALEKAYEMMHERSARGDAPGALRVEE